jgi:sugar phosphate isomerase/epimerase
MLGKKKGKAKPIGGARPPSNYRVGVTTGLYTIARAEELATTVRKLGFALTRGTSVIEIAGDVPHEVTQTEGREIRYIAGKQGLEILWHGSLTIPMCMPERGEYRDAQDHMMKSVRSAVYSGAKYVDFHACLNIWLELMTYAGRKLTMVFCDHNGKFISEILKENERLREWFIKWRWDDYVRDILTADEMEKASASTNVESENFRRQETESVLTKSLSADGHPAEVIEHVVDHMLTSGILRLPPQVRSQPEFVGLKPKVESLMNEVRFRTSKKQAEISTKNYKRAIREKLAAGGRWRVEELRTPTGVIDGYHIMAHYLFYTKDPMWMKMAGVYKDVLERYGIDYNSDEWLFEAWHTAEASNDRDFKEFFYAVVGAKFLQGHLEELDRWVKDEFIPNELSHVKDSKERAELEKIANDIKFAIEIPDARDPAHAGLFLLWHPKQIYAAVKAIRENMGDDRVWLLEDWEHLATQGRDPVKEFEDLIKIAPDMGELTLSVHANAPNPMHAHEPLELGDVRIYKLLYYMRQTGFGKNRKAYVIYERGGAKDPYQKAIAVLRLAVASLDKGIHPDELPEEYFGMKGPVAGDFHRQKGIMQDHAWEPLKDLLEIPEEEWTFLSQTAIKKGKKPDAWKKGEFR